MPDETAPDSDLHLQELLRLLEAFEDTSVTSDLRSKVQALVPIRETLRSLGKSLIPSALASSARDRILHYFLAYPHTIIPREELEIIAGITEWARRVRELRVQFGWNILSGPQAQQLQADGDSSLDDIDVGSMRSDDYILVSTARDDEAADRWRLANDIRNSDLSVGGRILKYLQHNVDVPVSGKELQYVAKNATEWARRIRELRTEYGWPIATKVSGRPDLSVGEYILEADRQSPPHDRKIKDATRRQVLRRDGYTCRRCSWNHDLWNPSDARHLELHHIVHHGEGGSNEADNLITLCTVCHDLWHSHDNQEAPPDFDAWLNSA